MESQNPLRQPHSTLISLEKCTKGYFGLAVFLFLNMVGHFFYVLKVSNGRKSTTERTESSVLKATADLEIGSQIWKSENSLLSSGN